MSHGGRRGLLLAACLLLSLPLGAVAENSEWPRGYHPVPARGDIIGDNYRVTVQGEQTLLDIARAHNVGYEEIRMANPDVSVWAPRPATEVVIPARRILPEAPREGIVVNLAEMRLYYYSAADVVETYPVSVGRDGFATPVGVTRTTVKVEDPSWTPPASMREEAAARGEPVPEVVPAGPDNPLGEHAILLDLPSYLIHGTNRPDGVGMRVSRGCIRMFPEDIESLFERVPAGTKVNIIDQPFKAGWSDAGVLFVQSFPQLEENVGASDPLLNALEVVFRAVGRDDLTHTGYVRLRSLVDRPDGVAVPLQHPGGHARTGGD